MNDTLLTKKEFCKYTHTNEDCWMFADMNGNAKFFTREEEGDRIFYFDNGIDTVRRFKDMPQYKEIWMSKAPRSGRKKNQWSLYSRWTDY